MVAEVRHRLLPKQDAAMFATERHVLYSGAVGAGKSRLLCIRALTHCAGRPKARFGLFRKTRKALVDSTIKSLLEGDGDAPPILPHGGYTHNKNEGSIRLNGGGEILYTGVPTPEAIGSLNLSGAGVDEATELDEDDYNAIDDRVRLDIGLPLQILSASNPASPSHWMGHMMGISPDKKIPDPDCIAILTQTSDNEHLPPSYINKFKRHEGTLYYRRMFLGEWCGSEGLVFSRWDRQIHTRRFLGKARRWHVGVDEGTENDPFVVLRIAEDDAGALWVTEEHFGYGMIQTEKIDTIRRMSEGAYRIVVDNAAPDLIRSMQRANMPAVGCSKGPGSVNHGIMRIQTRLVGEGSGPTLYVDPECTNTMREFESYEYKPVTKGSSKSGKKFLDVPYDLNNHAMDVLRYVDRTIETASGASGRGVGLSKRSARRAARAKEAMWKAVG